MMMMNTLDVKQIQKAQELKLTMEIHLRVILWLGEQMGDLKPKSLCWQLSYTALDIFAKDN